MRCANGECVRRPRLWVGVRATVLVVVLALTATACHRLVILGSPSLVEERTIQTRPFVNTSITALDGEGMAYVPRDGTLWLADDNRDRLYEVKASTGALLSMITSATLATTPRYGGGPAAGTDRVGDLEAVAYDETTDVLYAVSDGCCTPTFRQTIYRLTRSGSTFAPESWQDLPRDFPAAGSTPAGELYLASASTLHLFDYPTATLGPGFTIDGVTGTIQGLSFSEDGLDAWIGTGLRVYRVDWPSRSVVPGYEFDVDDHGLGVARAVEIIGGRLYVMDGDDTLSGSDPLKYAIHVYRIDGTRLSPALPVAGVTATPASGAPPLSVMFDAGASYDPDGTIVRYHWFLPGGGPIVTTTGPTHTRQFGAPGTYQMTVTLEDDGGNLRLAIVTVTASLP